jgi:hypothetical protein
MTILRLRLKFSKGHVPFFVVEQGVYAFVLLSLFTNFSPESSKNNDKINSY